MRQPRSVEGRSTGVRDRIGVLLFLGLCGLLVYGNAFHNPFIWDDQFLITENHFITSLRYLPEIFTHQLYYSSAGMSNFYRPLQTMFLMADYAFWETNVFGYHLTSVLFHVGCGWLVFLLTEALFHRRAVAVLVSLLFVIHPINSTVVNYIASRADSQVTLFLLLSCWLVVVSEGLPDGARGAGLLRLAALGSFVLALLSKELGVILPLLLVVSVAVLGRQSYRRVIPFVVVLALYGGLRMTVLNFSVGGGPGSPLPLGTRLLTTSESFVRLMGLVFVPSPIHIEKTLAFSTGLAQPSTLASLIVLLVVGIFAVWVRRRSMMCFFGLAWFFVALLPMANIVPINATIADHWLYLPCLGLFLAVVGGAADWIRGLTPPARSIATRCALGAYGVVAVIFSAMTVKQNTVWGSPERYFRLALEHNSGSFRAHNELGAIYLDRKEYARAVEEFQQSVRINPRFDQAYDNLGVAYDHQGHLDLAVAAHMESIRLNPRNPKTYNNLGNAYFKEQRWDKAIEAYQAALKLNPAYKAVYNNLGAVHYKRGDFAKAKATWEQALQIDPHFETAAKNLQVLRQTQGRQEQ